MTQFEAMLLNQEMMAQLQDRQAQNQFDRQQQAQQGQGGYGGGVSQGEVARGGQMESPKPMALPKFPIAGSRWNAKQIAQMPLNDLSQRIDGGELPHPKKLLIDMANQEPNILDQMSDEVKQYFEHILNKDEENANNGEVPKKTLDQWMKDLRKRYTKDVKRSDDMTSYLQDVRQRFGQPLGVFKPRRRVRAPGKPGQPPSSRGV